VNRGTDLQSGYSPQNKEVRRRTSLKALMTIIGSLIVINAWLAACAILPKQAPPPVLDQAEPVPTSSLDQEGDLTVGVVQYPNLETGTLSGYLAYQTTTDAAPAIVVLHEWWGLDDHVKDVTRRLANEGFIVLSPDLYRGFTTTEPEEARQFATGLSVPQAIIEIQQAILFLLDQEYVNSNKVGIMGLGMGGDLALLTVLEDDHLAAAVIFYGFPLAKNKTGQVKIPVLTLVGSEDQSIRLGAVMSMHAGFDEAGIENAFQIYEGAHRAFFDDTRSRYEPTAAADAWTRTLDWFHHYLDE